VAAFLVRFDEMEQSRRIILQAAERIPGGSHILEDSPYVLPPKDLVYNTMEGLIAHFKVVMHGVDPPKGDTVWMIQTVPANNVFQGSAKRVVKSAAG
jgi:NADH-quinone oxidoreductase subunit D